MRKSIAIGLSSASILAVAVLFAPKLLAQVPVGGAPPAAQVWKVADEYHAALTEDDFTDDPTGERNRDPFKSFLAPTAPNSSQAGSPMSAQRNIVAGRANLATLEISGIMKREGGRFFAMFSDKAGRGYEVEVGDYLSKDEFRVKEVTSNVVILEMGVLGPDQKPLTQEIRLFPDDKRAPNKSGRPLLTDDEESVNQ